MAVTMKKRILFVDDEPNILEGLSRMLHGQREVWDMCFVANAYAAFDQISQSVFDAIVLDVKMPCMDGFRLLEKVRNIACAKDVPVLIITGEADSLIKQRALDMGATDLLCKPINKDDLVTRLNDMLQTKSCQGKIFTQNVLLDREAEKRIADLENSRLDIICRLGTVAEYRDYKTGNHVMRVGCHSRVIAEELGMGRDFIETLFLAGTLHDVGKIGIPDAILLKQGKLSPEEFEVMKQHCAIGVEILSENFEAMKPFLARGTMPSHVIGGGNKNPLLAMASSIAMSHHERWDGTGYPHGLAGDRIPIEARIVALSDAYDALCSVRPYRQAYPESESLRYISKEVGKGFDPRIHEAFVKSLKKL
ncbi:MAG: response regulator [Planctomycetes bacterium]|nr:response regulator [Planctomycetota bacterium]